MKDPFEVKLNIEKIDRDEDMYPERDSYSIVDARYVARAMVTDNPDLCALQHPFSAKKLLSLATVDLPGYSFEETKKMSMYERKESVLRLQNVFYPLAHIFELSDAINDALESSYLSREIKVNSSNTALISRPSGLGGRPLSFAVFGLTGVGKTVAVHIIRKLQPTGIHHAINNIEYVQIPIIMVTALVGNMSELLIAIAQEIDTVFGNGPIWEQRTRKNNLGLSASVIKEAIRTYHIGLIIIDESQFMKFDDSRSSLENLVGISESTGCTLGLIGNKDLIQKLNKYSRLVGRTMYHRIEISTTEEVSRAFFEQAVRHLWKYQWTKEYTELTDEIMDELIKGAMYNICILKNLLMRIQVSAISKYPQDGITPKYIRQISEKRFSVIRTLILEDSEESERVVLKLLKQNVDDIKNDVKRLKVNASLKYLEERKMIEETWGSGRYEELEKIVKEYGVSGGSLKKIINKLMISDPNLPRRDIASIADDVKQYVEEHKKDLFQSARAAKKQVDVETEQRVRDAMKDSLKDLV